MLARSLRNAFRILALHHELEASEAAAQSGGAGGAGGPAAGAAESLVVPPFLRRMESKVRALSGERVQRGERVRPRADGRAFLWLQVAQHGTFQLSPLPPVPKLADHRRLPQHKGGRLRMGSIRKVGEALAAADPALSIFPMGEHCALDAVVGYPDAVGGILGTYGAVAVRVGKLDRRKCLRTFSFSGGSLLDYTTRFMPGDHTIGGGARLAICRFAGELYAMWMDDLFRAGQNVMEAKHQMKFYGWDTDGLPMRVSDAAAMKRLAALIRAWLARGVAHIFRDPAAIYMDDRFYPDVS